MPVEAENGNNTKNIAKVDAVTEIVGTVLENKPGDKRVRFFLMWILGLHPKVAAKVCGYNEDYGFKLTDQYRNNQSLRQHIDEFLNIMPERFRSLSKLRLATVAEIEGAALQEYQANPKLAIDKPQLLKHMKQASGVLSDESGLPPTVSIEIRELVGNQIRVVQEEFPEFSRSLKIPSNQSRVLKSEYQAE